MKAVELVEALSSAELWREGGERVELVGEVVDDEDGTEGLRTPEA
jgi:hypothetical protein